MSEWKEVQLNDTCNLIAGYAVKSKDFGSYPTKVLKIADINPPFVSSEKSSGVDLSNYDVDKLDKYIVKKGDYILAMTGATIGKLGRYVSDEHAYLNQRVLKFKPYQSIDSDFLYYVLCGRLFAKYIINHIDSESAQPNISAGTIGKYRFNLPNFETQQKIASILSSLDSKIENNRKICANLEAQAQALFKHWFIDFAPFKDGKFVESELGMIPEGWRVGSVGDVVEQITDKVKDRKDIKVLSPINSGELVLSDEYFTKQVYSKSIEKYILVKPLDFAYNPARVNIGSIGMNEFHFYIDMVRKGAYFKRNVNKLAIGGVRQTLRYEDLSRINLIIPPLSIIRDYNTFYYKIKESVKHLIQENLRLSTLRDTLLPKLMSREIKV